MLTYHALTATYQALKPTYQATKPTYQAYLPSPYSISLLSKLPPYYLSYGKQLSKII